MEKKILENFIIFLNEAAEEEISSLERGSKEYLQEENKFLKLEEKLRKTLTEEEYALVEDYYAQDTMLSSIDERYRFLCYMKTVLQILKGLELL